MTTRTPFFKRLLKHCRYDMVADCPNAGVTKTVIWPIDSDGTYRPWYPICAICSSELEPADPSCAPQLIDPDGLLDTIRARSTPTIRDSPQGRTPHDSIVSGPHD